MGLLFLTIFLLISTIIYCGGRTTFAIMMSYLIISPDIQIFGMQIDSIYLAVLYFLILILRTKPKIKKPPVVFNAYLKLIILVYLVYSVSWLVFSRLDFVTYLSCVTGAIKILLFLLEVWIMNESLENLDYTCETAKMIGIVLIINFVFILFQKSSLDLSMTFLDTYLSNEEYEYMVYSTKYGYYNRFNGLFAYPMHMGLFGTYAIAFLTMYDHKLKSLFKWILIFIAGYIGILSASKSFIFGVVIFYCLNMVRLFIQSKSTAPKKYSVIGVFLIAMLFIIFYNQIYNLVLNVFGSNFARYILMLSTPMEILSTRFDADTGAINDLMYFLENHFFFGVGPSSIMGEYVMDNAFYMILHNGGMLAVSIVAYFYTKLVFLCKNKSNHLIMIFLVFVTGLGFQTWIVETISVWIIFYIVLDLKESSSFSFDLKFKRSNLKEM
ncbi:hypothetical protein [Tannockella kyphosi]|uniref:hypothetical protein n=1 Tax=Tannockella kyphosi TaxID=2899121 RepID=UPI0020121CC8|nr:hypothetical protein [Tannockella kyphosi]